LKIIRKKKEKEMGKKETALSELADGKKKR